MLALDDVCTIQQSYHDRQRAITITLHMRIWPYARQTGRSRWKSGREGDRIRRYNAFLVEARDLVALALRQAGILPFGKQRLRVSGEIRLPHNVATTTDLSNLIKAVEDTLNGCVWDDDRQIHEYGAWRKVGVQDEAACGCTLLIEEVAA